jgi:hypothetical protein
MRGMRFRVKPGMTVRGMRFRIGSGMTMRGMGFRVKPGMTMRGMRFRVKPGMTREEIIGLGGGDVAFVRGEEGEGVGLDGEAVAAFVLGVPGMTLDPRELQGETGRERVEPGPQVVVLLALPAFRDGADHVGGVAEDMHFGALPADGFQALDHGEQLHAVVGRAGEAAAEFLADLAAAEHDTPAAGTRVPAGCTVGVEVYGRSVRRHRPSVLAELCKNNYFCQIIEN